MRLTAVLLSLTLAAVPQAAGAFTQTASHTFYLLTALQRSQGMTTDGTSWYFSWQFGLSRVSLDLGRTEAVNAAAIPVSMLLQGDDHIGDIDYSGGKIYAPVEDGDDYQHPHVAVYDAATLKYTGVSYTLPVPLQTDGVPWVAVDTADGYLISSEYNASAINEYSLADGSLVRQVPLSTPIAKIQGAKLYQGYLYASSNGPTSPVYRIDPATGAVTDVLDPGLPSGTETEGLAFLPLADGSVLHRLEIPPARVTVVMRDYRQS